MIINIKVWVQYPFEAIFYVWVQNRSEKGLGSVCDLDNRAQLSIMAGNTFHEKRDIPMITGFTRLFAFVVLGSLLAALSGCASVKDIKTVEFQTRPKPEDLICSVDSVTVKVSAVNGLAPDNSFISQMESEVTAAIYKRKKFSPCAIFVPRDFVLDMKITRLTEEGRLAGLMSPKIDQILFDGDFVVSSAAPKNDTFARFSMKNSFAWGCPIKDSHVMWGMFANSTGQGGECGSATSLVGIEDNFAEDIAKVIVVTPIPPPTPASDTVKTGKPGDGKSNDKPAKEKPATSK